MSSDNEILEKARYYSRFLKNIFFLNLNVRKNSKVLIFSDGKKDEVNKLLSLSYYIAAKKIGLKPILIFSNSGDFSSLERNVYLLGEKSSVILNLTNKLKKEFVLLGTSFKRYCKKNNIKFILTTSLGSLEMKYFHRFIKSLTIDYKKLRENMLRFARNFTNAKTLFIKTKNGTKLKVNIFLKQPLISDGLFDFHKLGGNLPAGEVYFATKIRGVSGTVVIDGSIRLRKGTLLVNTPVIITIENGMIKDIKGKKEAEALKNDLIEVYNKTKNKGVFMIGEVGIGFNPNAKIVGSTIIDEKSINTAHIAIGSNVNFGGSINAPIHLDQVFRYPEIYIDGKKIKLENYFN